MKYLRKFETKAEQVAWRTSEEYVMPNVSLVENVVNYNVSALVLGVSIQHIDGSLYTVEQWTEKGFDNSEANGVAYLDDDVKLVVAKTNVTDYSWADDTYNYESLEGVTVAASGEDAVLDFSGRAHSELIAANTIDSAALRCVNYIAPNGQHGYLGAIGEWVRILRTTNITEINNALALIGGEQIIITSTSVFYWSSTQASTESKAWRTYKSSSSTQSKSTTGKIRPFLPLE